MKTYTTEVILKWVYEIKAIDSISARAKAEELFERDYEKEIMLDPTIKITHVGN